jgi:hypothetical protein
MRRKKKKNIFYYLFAFGLAIVMIITGREKQKGGKRDKTNKNKCARK